MNHILITGPVAGIDRYQAAAEGAGWEATPVPLLAVEPRAAVLGAASGKRPDWICITSSNALHALETLPEDWRDVPLAVVGRRTLELVQALDFQVALGPAASAKELATELRLRRPKDGQAGGGQILWPRGNLGTELGDELRAAGFDVVDPVVYETTANREVTELPEADAVFLASPSAVYRFVELEGARPGVGIAIGPTTSGAIVELGGETPLFERSLCLSEPSPAGLRSALESIGLDA